MTRKTYRIEIQSQKGCMYPLTWYALPKGKTDGVIMAIDAMHGSEKMRAVCEQTNEVYRVFGGRAQAKTQTEQVVNRRTRMLDLIAEYWNIRPHMRLCELLHDIAVKDERNWHKKDMPGDKVVTVDLFYALDEALEEQLKKDRLNHDAL